MATLQRIGQLLDRVGLRGSINEVRFRVTRPDWWRAERARREFLAQFVGPGRLCFDIGANVGGYTDELLKLGARVVAAEPQPFALARYRERHAAAIASSAVTLVGSAVGAEEGTAEMLCPGEGSEIASLAREWIETTRKSGRFAGHEWDRSIRVGVTTLDRLIDAHGLPSFCKIDVEGYEAEVLKGLSRPIPGLSFEYTPECVGQASACLRELARIGRYRFNISLHGSNRLHWGEWLPPEVAGGRFEGGRESDLAEGGDIYARLA